MRGGVMAVLVLCVLCAYPAACLAEDVGSNDLIENAQTYDGRQISYSGEVIGDILGAGDYEWLNVSDGANAIGVWIRRDLAHEVKFAGRYAWHGDTIRITGTFHRACPDHGGDFDIHAESIELIRHGHLVDRVIARWKPPVATFLAILSSASMVLGFIRLKRRRYL